MYSVRSVAPDPLQFDANAAMALGDPKPSFSCGKKRTLGESENVEKIYQGEFQANTETEKKKKVKKENTNEDTVRSKNG